jgi:competence protein ComEA
LAGALVAALLLGSARLITRQPAPAPIVVHPPPTLAVVAPPPTATPAPLVVYVTGAVHAPGLYALPLGARVADALHAAGGLTPDANPNAVNQATLVRDGDQIYAPTQTEAPAAPPPGVSGGGHAETAAKSVPLGPINLNTATAAQLESLPGIGPSRAQAIIAGRPYATVDELDRVPGIGPATLDELRPYVVVE